jgi:ADP-ribose pyrophosphatase YjhB (NUDIX family)
VEHIHKLNLQGRDITMIWVGHVSAQPARVYALAFTSEGHILLVSGGPEDPYRWLPGGGIEAGESPEQGLRRELLEEADAVIEALEYLGSQHLEDNEGWQEYQHFYWCRVTLLPPTPIRMETTLRHLVSPDDFLDTLEWGHSDPKAAMLLERALDVELKYKDSVDPRRME